MNPLMREAALSVEMGWLLGLLTVVFFASFIWWVWYAYSPKHKERMRDASLMPFDGGEG
jgi:cbb3-type cytochrome oxidase subunit 3